MRILKWLYGIELFFWPVISSLTALIHDFTPGYSSYRQFGI